MDHKHISINDMNSGKSINRVELQGRVGTVRISPVGRTLAASFSLMTEHLQRTSEGKVIVEACWHNVAAMQDEVGSLDGLTRGALVHLEGRLRNSSYTAADGTERVFTETVAESLEVLE